MKIKQLEWNNIGPFGNKFQTIKLSDKGGLWMVTGKNGNGKSFFVNLPKILFYGKLDKFKKSEIANRINEHGWIRGKVQVNPQTEVTIERKFNPTNLIVYKHKPNEIVTAEHDIGKAGISNYQNYIDQEVTELPYHIFSNIISLSVNDFKSFISMTPNDKRIIIDKLFAMEVINKMNEFLKADLREVKLNMTLFDREISSLKINIDNATSELSKLKKQVSADNVSRIKKITTQIEKYKPKLKEAYEKRTNYLNKKSNITNNYNLFLKQKNSLESQISNIKKQINLFNKSMCPTCGTPFTGATFEIKKEDLEARFKSNKTKLEIINKSETKYSETFSKLDNAIKKINEFIIQYESVFKSLNNELSSLKINKTKEFKSIENIIKSNSEKLANKENEKLDFDDNLKYLTMLEEIYSDSGAKKKILENYLPTLNSEIYYTLNELHFPYTLSFNDKFEPLMQHLGIQISVNTLSTGEKKRVDLAILISIIRMLKRKFPNINIFMIDEILSSIDGDGIYDIIGLLQKISKELNINIFIINHSPLPIEHFDYRISITKNDGFSDLEIEEFKTV